MKSYEIMLSFSPKNLTHPMFGGWSFSSFSPLAAFLNHIPSCSSGDWDLKLPAMSVVYGVHWKANSSLGQRKGMTSKKHFGFVHRVRLFCIDRRSQNTFLSEVSKDQQIVAAHAFKKSASSFFCATPTEAFNWSIAQKSQFSAVPNGLRNLFFLCGDGSKPCTPGEPQNSW